MSKPPKKRHIPLYYSPEDKAQVPTDIPCMRDEYQWSSKRPDVPDSRVSAKANNEYHTLSSLAEQYAAQGMYKMAALHYRVSAEKRKDIIDTLSQLGDAGHRKAYATEVGLAEYYEALTMWQGNPISNIPRPEEYGVQESIVQRAEQNGEAKFNAVMPSFSSAGASASPQMSRLQGGSFPPKLTSSSPSLFPLLQSSSIPSQASFTSSPHASPYATPLTSYSPSFGFSPASVPSGGMAPQPKKVSQAIPTGRFNREGQPIFQLGYEYLVKDDRGDLAFANSQGEIIYNSIGYR